MEGLFPVYRLEEYGGLLQEGGGGLPVLLLRACSYKTKAEARHQGNAPILFKGFITVFVNTYQEPRTVLNDNTDNEDNRNSKGNLCCLCCMSPRDIRSCVRSFRCFCCLCCR